MPIPRSLCPTCGYLNGDHVYPAAPPVMMCLNCGATNCFDEKFRLVAATPDDLAKLNIYQQEIIDGHAEARCRAWSDHETTRETFVNKGEDYVVT